MARVKPIDIVESISGKVSQHSNESFVTNKTNGKTHTRITDPHKPKPERTEKQKTNSSRFGLRQKLTAEWLRANRPSEENPLGTELYQKARAAMKAQTGPMEERYGNLTPFVRAHMNDDGEVVL